MAQKRLFECVKLGTGFIFSKNSTNNSGIALFLTKYKGYRILSVLDAICRFLMTVANVVLKGANFYKELFGNEIESDALANGLKVQDIKPAATTKAAN